MTGPDHGACLTLVAEFYHRLDGGDAAGVAALFAPDGSWLRLGTALTGRDAIADAVARRDPARVTAHVISNLRLSGDARTARCGFYLAAYDNAGGGGPRLVSVRRCEDRLRKDGDTWLIKHKTSAALLPAT